MEEKKLYRSKRNRKVCGVCGGIGEYFNIDPTIVRLGLVALMCINFGSALIAYFIAAVIMADEKE